MPTYVYKCSICKKEFDEYSPKSDYHFRTISPCCKAISHRIFALTRFFMKIAPSRKNTNPLTNDIPIGNVPGDNDYTNEYGGHKMGEDGYIGPLP
jgi:DNA-directed RNA polymerase subunit RPC12/RpoP